MVRKGRVDRPFQAVVIGAGSSGLTAARRLAVAGKRTALVEADRLGGDCLNWGCVPTKTLVSTAKLRHQIAHAGDIGLEVGAAQLDFAAVKGSTSGSALRCSRSIGTVTGGW
jgi:dihydrolipoamide dehydrogenase